MDKSEIFNIAAKPVYVMLFGTTHVRPVAAGGQLESLPIRDRQESGKSVFCWNSVARFGAF